MSWQVRYAEGRHVEIVNTYPNSWHVMRGMTRTWVKLVDDVIAANGQITNTEAAKILSRLSIAGAGFEFYAWREIAEPNEFNAFCERYRGAFEQALMYGVTPGDSRAKWMAAKKRAGNQSHAMFSADLESLTTSMRASKEMKPYKDLQVFYIGQFSGGLALRSLVRVSKTVHMLNPRRVA